MKTKKAIRGWCVNCGGLSYADAKSQGGTELVCRVCGDHLKPMEKLTVEERAMADMQAWFSKVCRDDLNGPSPIGAAEELDCSRSMIDRLVERGILEKSEYTFKDRSVIIISRRSIAKAKENRERTRKLDGTSGAEGGIKEMNADLENNSFSERLIRLPELSRIFGVCARTVRRESETGELPPLKRIGRAVGMLESQVKAYFGRLSGQDRKEI